MSTLLLKDAVAQHAAMSREGMLERLFVLWFSRLVYTQIWEDPAVDLAALAPAPGDRIAAIASGGCNILNYLAAMPLQIAAVDLNPAHIAFVKLKLAAVTHLPDHETFFRLFAKDAGADSIAAYRRHLAPQLDSETRDYWEISLLGRPRLGLFARGITRHGLLGRYLGFVHAAARLFGAHPERILTARTAAEQQAIFEAELAPVFDRPLVRALCDNPVLFYSLGIPPAQFAALRREGGGSIADLYRERLRRLACDFPLSENYFAWQAFGRGYDTEARTALPAYLRQENFAVLRERVPGVRLHHGSMTDYLAGQPAASFSGYVLLDAQDWMTPAQLEALWREIGRTARPGARAIFRTAAADSPLEPALSPATLAPWRADPELGRALHARDRSAIYGGFHVYVRTA